jgi:type IV pilus assembly protein PilW
MSSPPGVLLKMTAHPNHKITMKYHVNRGFTLVELMVALALSLLVVAASVSALLVSRQGFSTVDAVSQLRDNARFATDFITRLSVQSGYKDVAFVDTVTQSAFKHTGVSADPDPPISGFDNAVIGNDSTDPIGTSSNNSRNSSCSAADGTACANGSDILILRYQTSALNTESVLGGPQVDNAMFNCAGVPQTNTATSSSDVIESMLYVSTPTTAAPEPALMCKYRNGSGTTWANPTPLVQGVESFQVLYGTDGVQANTIPVAAAPFGATLSPGQPDTIPERYLRADQMVVVGNDAATKENWRRVRSLRIGLIVRGPVGSAQAPAAQRFFPFAPSGTLAAPPANFSDTFLNVLATDTRVRQVVTFTVYLHNFQGI